jgi:K(+)-stimulated pyrophosphate-energized sodium pump
MNLVSLLIVSAIVTLSVGEHANTPIRILIALAAAAGIAAAVIVTKRRSTVIGDDDSGTPASTLPPAPVGEPDTPADEETRQFESHG